MKTRYIVQMFRVDPYLWEDLYPEHTDMEVAKAHLFYMNSTLTEEQKRRWIEYRLIRRKTVIEEEDMNI